MRTTWFLAASLGLAYGCIDDNGPNAPHEAWPATCGLSHPESIAAHGERRFVSNIGSALAPAEADGDGFISELDERGELVELHAFAPAETPLHAPKGLAVVGERLYVADLDRVVGFALDTRERVFEAALAREPVPFLNDLAVLDEHTLLVSDTAGGEVLRLDLDDRTFTTMATGVPGANGLAFDARAMRAYVVGIGADFSGGGLYALDLEGRGAAAEPIEGPFGLFDGLAELSNGELVASDWVDIAEPMPGRLLTFSTTGRPTGTYELAGALRGPADFYYDRAAALLWVPETQDGCVRVIALP